MSSSGVREVLVDKILSLNILNKIIIFSFPLWVVAKFFPSFYSDIRKSMLIEMINLSEGTKYIDYTVNILVKINYILIGILAVMVISFLLQFFISKVTSFFGVYYSTGNSFRGLLNKAVFRLFISISIYIVGIALFSDLLLNYGKPLQLINLTNAKFVSTIPFIIILILISSALVLPIESNSEY